MNFQTHVLSNCRRLSAWNDGCANDTGPQLVHYGIYLEKYIANWRSATSHGWNLQQSLGRLNAICLRNI